VLFVSEGVVYPSTVLELGFFFFFESQRTKIAGIAFSPDPPFSLFAFVVRTLLDTVEPGRILL